MFLILKDNAKMKIVSIVSTEKHNGRFLRENYRNILAAPKLNFTR